MHGSSNSDDRFGFTEGQTSGRIVANVAHELKMPLAAMTEGHKHILALLKDARASLSKIPQVADKLLADLEEAEVTLQSTSNLSHFMKMSINQCIEYSHIKENHPLIPTLVSVHLSDALKLPSECVSSIDPAHHLEVVPPPAHISPYVIADLQWLQENLLCLLSNAVKHSNPERAVHTSLALSLCTSSKLREEFLTEIPAPAPVSSSVRVSPLNRAPDALHASHPADQEDPVMLLVEVEDTGVGLSDEAMQQLFTPQKMHHRQATGTGLGLLSLHKRIQALQGYCGVRSRRDAQTGCLFWFAFPYVPDEGGAEVALELVSKSKSSDAETNTTQTPDQYAQHAQNNSVNMVYPPNTSTNSYKNTHTNTNTNTTHSTYTPYAPAYHTNNVNTTTPLPETELTHDVLSSTLKNVLPSPMLFESDDNTDKFNTYAPFPVYQKRLSSRSLRSAMSNLPTTSFSAEVHTPIGKWENEVEPGSVNSTSTHVYGSGGSGMGSVTNSRPASINSVSGVIGTFSRANSGTATTRSTKGRSLILSLPNETRESASKNSFPSLEAMNISGNGSNSGAGASGAGVGGVVNNSVSGSGGVSSSASAVSGGASTTGPPLPPTNKSTHKNSSTSITTSAKHSNNGTPVLHAGTPPAGIPHMHTALHSLALPRTPPRGSVVRTVEPSPASSTGTPQHNNNFDNSWTPDCISMIRTHIYNILLVDDTPMILKMTSLILRRQGFDVTTAQNGAEAFSLIQSRRFDVVLMDLQMPVLDGLEAARRIRALEKSCADRVNANSGSTSGTGGSSGTGDSGSNGVGNGSDPVGGNSGNSGYSGSAITTGVGISADPLFLIAVSANSDPMIVLETLSAGYDNYIEKPFTVEQFESVLAKYLAKRYY